MVPFGNDAMVRHLLCCQPNSLDIGQDCCKSFRRIDVAMGPDPMASSQQNLHRRTNYFDQSIVTMPSNCSKNKYKIIAHILLTYSRLKHTFDDLIVRNRPIVLLLRAESNQDYSAHSTIPIAAVRNCSTAEVADDLAAAAKIHSN